MSQPVIKEYQSPAAASVQMPTLVQTLLCLKQLVQTTIAFLLRVLVYETRSSQLILPEMTSLNASRPPSWNPISLHPDEGPI